MRLDFYHLRTWSLEKALPQLLIKVLDSGKTALVLTSSISRAEELSGFLWAYEPCSWLVHGIVGDEGVAENNPVYLTDDETKNNNANTLVLMDGMTSNNLSQYQRCIEFINASDPDSFKTSYASWCDGKAAGYELYYWSQKDDGKWEEGQFSIENS